jgi:integrase
MKLSDIACKTAKPKDKPYKLSDGHGMFLEIRPNGRRYWRLKYRFGGKEKLLALGVYPLVALKEARERRDDARRLLDQDIDPGMAKKERRLKAYEEAENTFEKLTRDWHDNWKQDKTPKHAAAILSRFETDVFPTIGDFPVNKVTPQMILQVVKKAEARAAYDVARRIKQTCGQILRFGVATGRAERDCSHDIKDAIRPYKMEHFAALDIKEIPDFLKVLDKNEMRLYKQTQLAMRLLMLTFVRTSELINARWEEFDLEDKTWIIPAARMKMRRDHLVPLSDQAVAILQELKEMNGDRTWVFPNQVRPIKAMSNGTIIHAIRRMGYQDRMTGHGFRALAMTTLKEKLGYRHEVIDRQLAHAKKNKIVAAYDRVEFLDDRRKMMQAYADYLEGLCRSS